jgi:Holliday junction resolvase-like predicted endonuclease
MDGKERPPAGPRGRAGADAEVAVAARLEREGWRVLARNVRVGRCELDLLACPPATEDARLVIIEVRSRSSGRFGAAVESVDRAKVVRLYRAAAALARTGHPSVPPLLLRHPPRIDLVSARRTADGGWVLEGHIRGLVPP